MDLPPAWSQVCICGRTFSLPQAYTCHKRSCQKTKKRLSSALDKAKEVWQARKRRKSERKAATEVIASPSNLNTPDDNRTPGLAMVQEVRLALNFHNLFFSL
jgi:hypothetical protein